MTGKSATDSGLPKENPEPNAPPPMPATGTSRVPEMKGSDREPSANRLSSTVDLPRPGVTARPSSLDGRARAFRQEQAERRGVRRERFGDILVVTVLVLGVFVIATAHSLSSSSTGTSPNPGPTIDLHLGTPSSSTVTCGDGGTAYVERIPWTNSTYSITTGDVNLRVYEIWDGDFIGDPNAVANVTPLNLCAGAPPTPTAMWYAVLADPNGTNLLTYTDAHDWSSVSHGPWNVGIQNGSALVLVTNFSIAGTGRGFAVFGFMNGSPIIGTVPL